MALALVKLKDYDGALAQAEQALKLNRYQAMAYAHRALAWRGKGNLARARSAAAKALLLAPHYAETLPAELCKRAGGRPRGGTGGAGGDAMTR